MISFYNGDNKVILEEKNASAKEKLCDFRPKANDFSVKVSTFMQKESDFREKEKDFCTKECDFTLKTDDFTSKECTGLYPVHSFFSKRDKNKQKYLFPIYAGGSNRKMNKDCFAFLDNGTTLNLNEEIDWKDKTLSNKQKLFVFFYCYPFDNAVHGNGAGSARKAGFSEKTAKIKAATLLKDEKIISEIANFKGQISEKLTKINLKNEISNFIAAKIKRTKINVTDYYTTTERELDDGETYTFATAKKIDELTDEQKAQILDVEFVGAKGILHYKLPNKAEAENELIKLYRDITSNDSDNNGFEVETTSEIIKGNLQVKTKVMKRNEEIAKVSELKENSSTQRIEEA